MAKLTNTQQGELLGVGARYVQQLRERGLPQPGARESAAVWAKRARAWMAEHTAAKQRDVREDPDDPSSTAHYMRRWRAARAAREELELARVRGEVHSMGECHAETVQRLAALRAAFGRLPAELARVCEHAPADTILIEATRLIREAFDGLHRAAAAAVVHDAPGPAAPTVDAGDARGAAVAHPGRAKRVGRPAPRARHPGK